MWTNHIRVCAWGCGQAVRGASEYSCLDRREPGVPRGMQKPLRPRAQGQERGEGVLPRSHRCRAQKDTKHKKWDKTWSGKLDNSDHCSW